MFGTRKPDPEPRFYEWTLEFTVLAEDDIRRIVREELAELVPVDVPDGPPEDLR